MASLNGPSELQKPVSKRRLAMINMSDNEKIPIQQNHTKELAKSTKITIKKKKTKNYKKVFMYFKLIMRTIHGFTI